MPTEWPEVRLGDLVGIKHGWPFKSEFFSEDLTRKPIVINIGNFQYTGGFRFDSTVLKEYRDTYPEGYELTPGDVLLVMTCQTSGGEILGIPGRVPADGRTYLHNQRMGKVVIKHPSNADIGFLYWLFLWKDFNRELVTSASGTKILHTSPTRIEAFRFNLPPLRTQRAIARILCALDDKIELNRKMNETLEQMARVIFKSWFVDFEPFRDKGMVESELGEIPKGWDVRQVRTYADVEKGLSYKGQFLVDVGMPMVNLGCLTGHGRFNAASLKHYSGDFKPRHTVRPGDIVIANTDITQRREVLGSPAVVPPHGEAREFIFTHHVFAVRLREGYDSWKFYLYYSLLQDEFRERAAGFATGTTVLALPRDAVLNLAIPAPPGQVVQAFSALVEPLIQLGWKNHAESRTLAAIRDALLPKLMSGEVRAQTLGG